MNLVDQNSTNRETNVNGYTKGTEAPNSKAKHIIVAATA